MLFFALSLKFYIPCVSITGACLVEACAWGTRCILAEIQDVGCVVRAKKIAVLFAQLESVCIRKLKSK